MASKFQLPRAYGGVCFMVSLVTGNYLISRDIEKQQRGFYFDEDSGKHAMGFEELHRREIGDSLAP